MPLAQLGLDDVRARMIFRCIAYAYALKSHLRDEALPEQVRPYLPAAEWQRLAGMDNKPNLLMHAMGEDLRICLEEKRIDPCLAAGIDDALTTMTAAATACERIKSTPIPFSYALLLHRTAYLYCFLLPFGLVDIIGFMTPVVVAIVAYTFFGLDALGDEIEEPFGTAANDLPLDAIAGPSRSICSRRSAMTTFRRSSSRSIISSADPGAPCTSGYRR